MENITYIWDCRKVDTYPTSGEYKDVVFNVHWSLTGKTIVADIEYSALLTGSQKITFLNNTNTFVPFENLTNSLVSQWVQDGMGPEQVALYKSTINTMIEDQIVPVVITRIISEEI